MDLGLSGHVALVAGGSRGIGAATARLLAAEGARVAVLARSADEVASVVEEITGASGHAVGVTADVADTAAVEAALATVEERLGPPTRFVWCVSARFRHARLPQVDDDELSALIDVDLLAAARICRRLVPGMMRARDGRIVLLSSSAAAMGLPGGAAYAVGKAGLEALARGLTVDHGRHGIRANAIRLGFVDTERLRSRHADPAALARHTVTRRIADAAHVASLVAWLCSPLSRSVAGAVLELDDGLHLAPPVREPS